MGLECGVVGRAGGRRARSIMPHAPVCLGGESIIAAMHSCASPRRAFRRRASWGWHGRADMGCAWPPWLRRGRAPLASRAAQRLAWPSVASSD